MKKQMEMKSKILYLFLVLYAVLSIVSIVVAEPINTDVIRCKKDSGTYTPQSPYKTNLMTALKRLPDSISTYFGNKPDAVSIGALCAGYLKPKDCASCLNNTIPLLQQKCPNQKGAVAWRVKCMLRYGPPVTNNYDIWFVAHEISETKVKDVVGLEKALNSLGGMLSGSLDRHKLYAYGLQAYGSANQILHMVMQCSLDTSQEDCNSCLQRISREMKPCCNGAMAVAMLTPNCYLRYAHADFRLQ